MTGENLQIMSGLSVPHRDNCKKCYHYRSLSKSRPIISPCNKKSSKTRVMKDYIDNKVEYLK